MNFLARNLDALGRSNPEAARLLGGLDLPGARGQWTVSRSGLPTVTLDGVRLASAFDPSAEALKAVPAWGEDVDFALLPGLGTGYLAEAVAARYPDLPLVLAEADPRWFREVLVHRDLTGLWLLPRVVVLLGPDPAVVGSFFSAVSCRVVETLSWRPLAERDPGWHRAVADQVAGAQARGRVNLATFGRFASLWNRNLKKNEAGAREVRPLAALDGRWSGVPAVVAAAGPSLAEAFGWIEAHRDRVVLIAVDTAWPALAARNLVPDVLVVLDGQYWNARHVDREPPPSTLVVTEWIGPPRAFRLAPGRTYVAASSVPFLRTRESQRWGDLGTLASGGSVATAAWSLALHLGCPEVAFAGLDLGYPGGLTHVPGSQFEEALHRRSHRLSPAETGGLGLRGLEGLTWRPGLIGGPVRSDPRMDLFRDWLTASTSAHPEVRAVNLGTRGSLVPGLVPPPAGYGEDWPVVPPRVVESSPVLSCRLMTVSVPPFEVFRALADEPDFPAAVDRAWAAGRLFWGEAIWDGWAGRAKRTWDRFPSVRSRRALVETARATVAWEVFWKEN